MTEGPNVKPDSYASRGRHYLETLCSVQPNRRTGSAGNRAATDFFAKTARPQGYQVDTTPFDSLDHVCHRAELTHGGESFRVNASPYSLACDVSAELVVVSTVDELEAADPEGDLLLVRGEICSEQLMPKNFVFYNPEQHQRLIALLEAKNPAAIITATGRAPDQVGALYPFPLIVDGDFDIPSVYCTDTTGETLAALAGVVLHLTIDASRRPTTACNVIAKLNATAPRKVVLTAHIDAYENSPGASDNASGTAVLLLCAEMLADYQGEFGIEIVALNGEDHYSAGGQMDYLRRFGGELASIQLVVNVDDVGYLHGGTSYSFYDCPADLESQAEEVLQCFSGLVPGEPWFSGDHMIFVQSGVPAVALTAERMPELMRTVTHTAADTPDLVDPHQLVHVAQALDALVRSL